MAGAFCALLPLAPAATANGGRPPSAGWTKDDRLAAPVVRLAAETTSASERPARAAAGLGAGGGIERVVLRFEGAVPASLTALAESDLRTAFGRRGVDVVRREVGAGSPSKPVGAGVVLTIAIANERLEQVALKIEETSAASRAPAAALAEGAPPSPSSPAVGAGDGVAAGAFTLSRRLDLTAFPPDGRMLALVVAADEMLVAAGTEHGRLVRAASRGGAESSPADAGEAQTAGPRAPVATEATAPTEPGAPPPPAAAEIAGDATPGEARLRGVPNEGRSAPMSWPENGLAAMFAFDRFGGGQTHLGLDLAWRRRLGARWLTSLAAQGRQGRTITTTTGTVDSRWLGGRLALGLTLADDEGRLWLTVDAGARAGRLRFEGRGTAPDGRPIGHQVDTFSSYVDATVALDVRLGRSPLALRLSAGAGLPLLAQDVSSGDSVVTGASGAAFESQAGLVVSF